MSFCPECGPRQQPDVRFCTNCGTSLSAITQPLHTFSAPPPEYRSDQQAPANGMQAHTTKPGILALLAAVVVLALVLVGGTTVLLVSHNTGGQPKGSPVAATTTPTTSTSTSTRSTSASQTFPALYRQVSGGVVRIETTACNGGGVGSGFLVAPNRSEEHTSELQSRQ